MKDLVCGTCGFKYETYDDLEACLLKHLEKIKEEQEDDMEDSVQNIEINAAEINVTDVKLEIKQEESNEPWEEPDNISDFVQCDIEMIKEEVEYNEIDEPLEESSSIESFEPQTPSEQHTIIISKEAPKIHQQKPTVNFQKFSLTCHYCSEIFASYADKLQHIINFHPTAVKYECFNCKKFSASNKETLNKHINKCTLIKCDQCPYTTRIQSHFKYHMRIHAQNYAIKRIKALSASKTPSRSKPEKRPKLSKETGPRSLQETGPRPQQNTPQRCQQETLYKSPPDTATKILPESSSSEPLKRSFNCYYCGETFDTWPSLRSHQTELHSLSKLLPTLKCPHCDTRFVKKAAMNYHIREVHPSMELAVRYRCSRCRKIFEDDETYSRHMEEGCKVTFRCNECPFSTSFKRSLTRHKKRHEMFSKFS